MCYSLIILSIHTAGQFRKQVGLTEGGEAPLVPATQAGAT